MGLVTLRDEHGESHRKRRKAPPVNFDDKENGIAALENDAEEWAKRAEKEREEDQEFRSRQMQTMSIQMETMGEILKEL